MNTATVTMQLDPSTAALLRVLQLKAAAQGMSLHALLKPLAEAESESTQVPFKQIENLFGVIDSREPFERTPERRDAFERGLIAKLEQQGLKGGNQYVVSQR